MLVCSLIELYNTGTGIEIPALRIYLPDFSFNIGGFAACKWGTHGHLHSMEWTTKVN
jgi:hypothetical protein